MLILPLLAACAPSLPEVQASQTTMYSAVWSCDDLGAGDDVSAILVEGGDPWGWVATYGAGGHWEVAEQVEVRGGDLGIWGGCASGMQVRLSWW